MIVALTLAVAIGTSVGPDAERTAPNTIVVATARGEMSVQVTVERGHPALAVPALAALLPVEAQLAAGWATVGFADHPFRFLLDAPVFVFRGRTEPLVGGAYVARDTLFVPLQWLTVFVPQVFREAYHYDPIAARFEDARLTPVIRHGVVSAAPASDPRGVSAAARASGFRMPHKVVIDPGHGGRDAGTIGRHLPRGVNEKHVTLAIARELRTELEARGVSVIMTRTTDAFVNLLDRAPMCRNDCDLFISIHVNSLRPRRGYEQVRGFETYFLDEARTADAARVAQMENEAIRYEIDASAPEGDALAFIVKDLHTNEYLRESALLADLVQAKGASVHPGKGRHVSQARFAVLSTARRPAILIETGFATNPSDGRFIASSSGQRRLAKAIANGVVEYLRLYEKKVLAGEVQ